MTDFERIADLVFRNLSGPLSAAERQELEAWTAASEPNRVWYQRMQSEEHLRQLFLSFRGSAAEASKARVLARIEAEINTAGMALQTPTVHRVHFLKRSWWKYAAAIVLICGTVAYLWNTQQQQEKPAYATTNMPAPVPDVAPGGNKALLTLADGSTIVLDSAADGAVARQQGASIIKTADGQIVYEKFSTVQPQRVVFNTLSTPRGGQYQLTLPDGSRVWLNAASSLTYPTVFNADERKVTLTGEAYFEVTKAATRPFIVETPVDRITVLGTHFNVNAYADADAVVTTLLEGRVEVQHDQQKQVLQPGQAAENGTVRRADVSQAVAWKNGLFNFNDKSLSQVLNELSRWYDLKVIYKRDIPAIQFGGKMGRDLNLSQVLKGLESSGLHFEIQDDRRLIVLP